MNFYSINDFNTIPKERLAEIKKNADNEYINFFTRKNRYINDRVETIDTYWKSSKTLKRRTTYSITVFPTSLENQMIYRSNSKSFLLENDYEKTYFLCESVYNSSEDLLKILNNAGILNILNDFVENINYIDKEFSNDYNKQLFQKKIYYNHFMKKNSLQIKQLITYMSYFYSKHDINIILSKLILINNFQPELYEKYLNTNKKLVKKGK